MSAYLSSSTSEWHKSSCRCFHSSLEWKHLQWWSSFFFFRFSSLIPAAALRAAESWEKWSMSEFWQNHLCYNNAILPSFLKNAQMCMKAFYMIFSKKSLEYSVWSLQRQISPGWLLLQYQFSSLLELSTSPPFVLVSWTWPVLVVFRKEEGRYPI